MTQARRLGLAAAIAACALAALPASAQTQTDMSGAWKFKTDVLPNKGCVISGDITFRRNAKTSDYACRFVSREDCDRVGGPTFTKVQQSCTARVVKGEVVITSTVDRILDAGPAGFKEQMFATQAYAPDHFKVRPSKGELIGIFHSSREAKVRFWREQDLVG